jgi:hypothetical protein
MVLITSKRADFEKHFAVTFEESAGLLEVRIERRVHGPPALFDSGGGVKADSVAGEIEAETSGGGVRISEAGGRVVASSSGGAVWVGFAAGNAKGGDLHSSGGGVHAWLDPAAALDIDAHSSGGGVSCDLPVTVRGKMRRNELEGKLNGGGAVLELSSSGGGVSIEGR